MCRRFGTVCRRSGIVCRRFGTASRRSGIVCRRFGTVSRRSGVVCRSCGGVHVMVFCASDMCLAAWDQARFKYPISPPGDC